MHEVGLTRLDEPRQFSNKKIGGFSALDDGTLAYRAIPRLFASRLGESHSNELIASSPNVAVAKIAVP